MRKPTRQSLLRRLVFQAEQKAFAAAGIHFAARRVTFHVQGVARIEPVELEEVERAAASAVAAAEPQAAKS